MQDRQSFAPLRELIGEEAILIGDIDKIDDPNDGRTSILISAISLNGEGCRIILRLLVDDTDGLSVCDTIRCNIEDISLPYGSDISRGIAGEAKLCGEIQSIGRSQKSLRHHLTELRGKTADLIRSLVSGEEGELITALLLGEDDGVSRHTKLIFRRSGLSHVLALSGMHLVVLTALLLFFLDKLHLPQKIKIPSVLLFVWFYTVFTGLSSSLLRAAIMLSVVEFGKLFRRMPDAYTSLFLSAALISVFSAGAVVSIGLWLSFLATFGIQFFKDIEEKSERTIRLRSLFRKIRQSLLFTLSALSFTMLLSALCFSEVSMISPIANLLLAPFFTLLLYASLFLLLLPLPSIGRVVAALCNLLLRGVEHFADIKGALLPLSSPWDFVPVFLFSFIVLCLVFLPIEGKGRIRRIFVGGFTVVFLLYFVLQISNLSSSYFLYQRSEDSDYLLFKEAGEVTVVDISGDLYDSRALISSMKSRRLSEIDTLIFTHYHKTSPDYIKALSGNIQILEICFLLPTDSEEAHYFRECEAAAKECGIKTARLLENTYIKGSLTVTAEAVNSPRSSHPAHLITAEFMGKVIGYSTSHALLSARDPETIEEFIACDTLILGAHPRKFSFMTTLDLSDHPEVIIAYENPSPYLRLPKNNLIIAPFEFTKEFTK